MEKFQKKYLIEVDTAVNITLNYLKINATNGTQLMKLLDIVKTSFEEITMKLVKDKGAYL